MARMGLGKRLIWFLVLCEAGVGVASTIGLIIRTILVPQRLPR